MKDLGLYMDRSDRLKRAVAYYISLALFLFLLPVVISYSLGYHIDARTLLIYKTGIVSLRSNPAGATVAVNGRILTDLTPMRIEELKPGIYRIEVRRAGFYPWQKDVTVTGKMATKVEDIVLFRVSEEAARVVPLAVVDFVRSEHGTIYYMTAGGLYRSDAAGSGLKRLSLYSNWPRSIVAKSFSPDEEKILFYDRTKIWVIDTAAEPGAAPSGDEARVDEIVESPSPILEVFWYSDSKHMIFITDREINAVELDGGGTRNTATLFRFSDPPAAVSYDDARDVLYFTDTNSDAKEPGAHLYRLELRQKFLDTLMRRFKQEFDTRYDKR